MPLVPTHQQLTDRPSVRTSSVAWIDDEHLIAGGWGSDGTAGTCCTARPSSCG